MVTSFYSEVKKLPSALVHPGVHSHVQVAGDTTAAAGQVCHPLPLLGKPTLLEATVTFSLQPLLLSLPLLEQESEWLFSFYHPMCHSLLLASTNWKQQWNLKKATLRLQLCMRQKVDVQTTDKKSISTLYLSSIIDLYNMHLKEYLTCQFYMIELFI